jgi:hypothetical protein
MSLSISLQLEATGYPGLDRMVLKSGILKGLTHKHPEKHMTLSIIIVKVSDILENLVISSKDKKREISLKDIFKDKKLSVMDYELVENILEKFMCEATTNFVLKEIKPLVDKLGSINLEFSDLDLWQSGHFVAAFNDDQEKGWDKMVKKTRKFLKSIFPKGKFQIPEAEVVPHLTLAKFHREDYRELKKKLKQPDWNVRDYKIMTKQWIIYPSMRIYRD